VSLYRLAAFLNRPLVRVLFRPQVRGAEHLPSGGFVLAPTHLSGWDIWAVAYALYPRTLRNMGKNQLFRRRFLGPLVRSLGAFPAHEEGGMGGGVPEAVALARAGEVVVIVPAGARRRLQKEHRLRSGAARTALEAGVPLVPAGVRGTDGWRRVVRWQVAYGPPVELGDLTAEEPLRATREATRRLSEAIAGLEATLR
jgi:1-acyl-sn-glycerol-3-phosphate acyltransferase